MKVGSVIRKKPKNFESFSVMMEWAERYYDSHPDKWGDAGWEMCISYDYNPKTCIFTLRGISEWSPSVISQVEFSGAYVADYGDRVHQE